MPLVLYASQEAHATIAEAADVLGLGERAARAIPVDQHLRMAKAKGVKFIINTDAHHTSHMEKIRYGVLQLRRAWLTKQDVLNTLPAAEFAKIVRRGRPVLAEIA